MLVLASDDKFIFLFVAVTNISILHLAHFTVEDSVKMVYNFHV